MKREKVARERSGERPRRSALLWLAMGLLIVVGLLLAAIGVNQVMRAASSEGWSLAAGVVEASRVVESSPDSCRAEVSVRFETGGRAYVCRRIRFADEWIARDRCDVIADVERYAAGRSVRVAFDPSNPAESVLEPGATIGDWFFVIFGGVVFGLGAIALIAPPGKSGEWAAGIGFGSDGGGDGGGCGDGGGGD